MKWKLLATMLLMGWAIFLSFWGFAKTESVTVMASDEPTVALSTTLEPPAVAESPFEAYPFYRAQYLERYIEYQSSMPNHDIETVLWHVNAGLDLPPGQLVQEVTDLYPLLINRRHRLPEQYEPEELTVIHGTVMATPGTAEAFKRMRTAAMQDGVFIEAAAGYHSLDTQREMFAQKELYLGADAAEAVMARPGYGEHSTGRALHIVDRDYTFEGFDAMPEFSWLMEHCADYGFILRYGQGAEAITGFAYEPYHFTFVGREIALAMKGQEIATLEEYVARGMAPLGDTPIDDRTAVVIVAGLDRAEDNTYESCVARLIQENLEAESVRVIVAHSEAAIENETKAAAMIAIEREGPSDRGGAVVWFASDRPDSRSLADTVGSRLSWAGLYAESRGIVEDSKIALTRLTEAPSVLVQVGGEPAEGDTGERVAKSISDAVTAHLGIRKMYLTFDDGPSSNYTPAVLEILREKGVKATFFVIGEMAEANPDMLREIVAEGHTIGIHCYSHDYGQLYESVESFVSDFDRAREVVRDITGLEPVIYRFPGGSVNNYNGEVSQQIIEKMNGLGYVYYDWNITAEDALGSVEAGDLMHTVMGQTRYRNAVLLMHDAYPNIAAELSDIIDYFSDYQMCVITGNTVPVQF